MSAGFTDDEMASRRVTPDEAMKLAPVWYAVSRISRHVGQLPIVMHKRVGNGAERDTGHAAYRLLKSEPNSMQTACVFKELVQADALLWGNGRAVIVRDTQRKPVELIPIAARNTATVIDEDGVKWHSVRVSSVEETLIPRTKPLESTYLLFPDADVLHVQGLGSNGIVGRPITDYASDSFGLGLSAEKQAKSYFDNGARPGIILEAPPGAFRNQVDAEQFLEAFNKRHQTAANAGKVGLLREGIKATTLSMTADQGQHIDNRRFTRQDAALWFLLESILGDGESNSYSSLEQKHLAYLTNCLMPWLVKWEEQVNCKMLSSREKKNDTHFAKFNVAALLRADLQTQVNTLGNAIRSRIMNPNEAREKLDLNPYDGGDLFENPAITPGQRQAPEPDAPDDEEANDARRNAAAKLGLKAIQSRIKHLAGVERQRIAAAIADGKPMDEWAEAFYASWERSFAAAIGEFGGTNAHAKSHCDAAKALVSAWKPGENYTETLLNAVETRANAVADAIFAGELAK
jgi:HK97 family phage portal protein